MDFNTVQVGGSYAVEIKTYLDAVTKLDFDDPKVGTMRARINMALLAAAENSAAHWAHGARQQATVRARFARTLTGAVEARFYDADASVMSESPVDLVLVK